MDGPALLFPGQASQFVGMGQDLCAAYPAARALFAAADARLGMPLTQICRVGPEQELRQTRVTQPAVFVHSVAAWQVLAGEGVSPAAVAGHSLGEYSALVAADVLDFETALELVQRRAQYMQEAAAERPGTMVAVLGLNEAAVIALCARARDRGIAVLANHNAPGQVVVSGDVAAVDRVRELALAAGARRAMPLSVGGAFHSPLLASAAQRLRELLQRTTLRAARVPVLANVTARPSTDPEEIRRNLMDQMTRPVRWVETVQELSRMGIGTALEVGPGHVLQGLVRRIAPGMDVRAAGTAESLAAVIAGEA